MVDIRNKSVDRLLKVIKELKSEDELFTFLQDLCTVKEILDMAQRFDIAIMLDNKESYDSICEKTGISTATISRVSRCLSYGSGGYKLAIERLKENEK